ncbi:MAG: hypothetical protein WBW80_17025 [Acidimicrobiales bacterium]
MLVTVDGPEFSHTTAVLVRNIDQVSKVQSDVAQVEGLIQKAKVAT